MTAYTGTTAVEATPPEPEIWREMACLNGAIDQLDEETIRLLEGLDAVLREEDPSSGGPPVQHATQTELGDRLYSISLQVMRLTSAVQSARKRLEL